MIRLATAGLLIAFCGLWYFSLPQELFNDPYSFIIEDREGSLLGARISSDEQWRFPIIQKVPQRFKECIITYEDKRFDGHIGIDFLAIARAVWQNIRAGEIVSGGSTITTQLIRLSRKGKPRKWSEKIIEASLATRFELSYTKDEILRLYSTHAPFGGNVVGLETAAWRYYGKSPNQLSWAESAALAVLPNAPSLIRPGKNATEFLRKRDFLLHRLYTNNVIDSLTYALAILEPLPGTPRPLPNKAEHLIASETNKDRIRHRIQTTIDADLQEMVEMIAERQHAALSIRGIENMAVLVAENESGKVRAYLANAQGSQEYYNDMILTPRSTGSILKPLLYTMLIDDGLITPRALVPDVPSYFSGFVPENYDRTFRGAVRANRALSYSLNIPAVWMLKSFGINRFHYRLKELGMTLPYSAQHYGLSLILGGAEISLWELVGIYQTLAASVLKYPDSEFAQGISLNNEKPGKGGVKESPTAVMHMLEAMLDVNRPDEERNWERFFSNRKVAWKTGTSQGFRDAWAVGLNYDYTVGVWVGNADGEGKPDLTGLKCAAPVLFEVFNRLPAREWFEFPYDDATYKSICQKSGFAPSEACETIDSVQVSMSTSTVKSCKYCKFVQLDQSKQFRVNSSCYDLASSYTSPWFSLPPLMENYYKNNNPGYKPLPPYLQGCNTTYSDVSFSIIYPNRNSTIFLPVDMNGNLQHIVFRAVHSNPEAIMFWSLDDQFIGRTEGQHEISVQPESGKQVLRVTDMDGNSVSRPIRIEKAER